LKELAKVSSFEIGAHTVNHPALGSLDEAHQEEEIRQSKNVLEEIIGKEITGFAYPYGHYNEITPDLVQKYGFSYAVTTEPRVAQNEDKLFEIPRFQVKNVNATVFEKELKQWKRG
jgi:peptidoglycan/xylan/chitin deacetylase (PgdA/CDA1 family)